MLPSNVYIYDQKEQTFRHFQNKTIKRILVHVGADYIYREQCYLQEDF